MTHHERPSFTLSDNTFHFVDGDPATILERAREAVQGKDVRLGGGATSSDSSSTRTSSTPCGGAPRVEVGVGSRLWESPEELFDRFHHEVVPSPSGVTHHLFWLR